MVYLCIFCDVIPDLNYLFFMVKIFAVAQMETTRKRQKKSYLPYLGFIVLQNNKMFFFYPI